MWPRAVLPLGIACVVELACARDDAPGSVLDVDVPPVAVMPDAAEAEVEESSLAFSPVDVWRVGQRWRTFAHRAETYVLTEYEVISIRDGVTTIRAMNLAENAEPPIELRFDADGQRIGGWPLPRRPIPEHTPQWPRFPLMETSAGGDPPGDTERQVVRREGGLFTVVLEVKSHWGRGPDYLRRVLQWEVGRPWFDSNSVFASDSPDSFADDLRKHNWETTIDWDLEQAPGSP